jgi:hypothetical protein
MFLPEQQDEATALYSPSVNAVFQMQMLPSIEQVIRVRSSYDRHI